MVYPGGSWRLLLSTGLFSLAAELVSLPRLTFGLLLLLVKHSKSWIGRIDIRTEVMSVGDIVLNPGQNIHEFLVVTKEVPRSREPVVGDDGRLTFAKTALKVVPERAEYSFGSPDQETLLPWKESIQSKAK